MSIKTRDELLGAFNGIIGEDTSDEALALIEDITDTFNDLNDKVQTSGDWQAKYEQNDSEWREKYKARFLSSGDDDDGSLNLGGNNDDDRPLTYDSLFKEV